MVFYGVLACIFTVYHLTNLSANAVHAFQYMFVFQRDKYT